jgi:hypothetical protein
MISTFIRPAIGLAALLATIPLLAMLPKTMAILFETSEGGWVALASFALMVAAYTAFQWKLTLLAAPLFRKAAKFLKLRK